MSGNIATVQAIYEAFGRGDIGGILAHVDPDIEWEYDWGQVLVPLFAPRRGHDGVRAFMHDLEVWEFLRFEPQAFLAAGDMVAVPVRIELRHRETGKTFRDLESHWFTFGRNGKLTRLRHMIDTAQVLACTS
jgi:hypothetical protein